MADLFEDRRDLDAWRERLWGLIRVMPWLDWLLLTKRIEHVADLHAWRDDWLANVRLGTTFEDQPRVDEHLPVLASVPAALRFISAEPLLGALGLREWAGSLDWLIPDGESGPHARPTAPIWFTSPLNLCKAADVASISSNGAIGCRSRDRPRQGQSRAGSRRRDHAACRQETRRLHAERVGLGQPTDDEGGLTDQSLLPFDGSEMPVMQTNRKDLHCPL